MTKSEKFIYDDVTMDYIELLRHHEDELGLVIKGHLLIEYLLNKIIDKKFKKAKLILEDSRSFTFSVKLKILYSLGIIPTYIYQNISFINKIRNRLAHTLNIDFDKIEFIFWKQDKSTIIINPKQKKKYPERHKIKLYCGGTLTQLRNFYYNEFGEFPEIDL